MNIKNVSYKTIYCEKLENIPDYTRCTGIPDVVKQELANLGIITIHDYIMKVGTNTVKVPGLSKARYTRILRIITNYLMIVYGDGIDTCLYSSTWNDWCNQYQIYHLSVGHVSYSRAMELLNAMIDHLSVAERNDEVIKKLLHIGFTEDELINEFNFCEDDVKEVATEMEEDEE